MGNLRITVFLSVLFSLNVSLSAAADVEEKKEQRFVIAPMVVFSPGFGNGGGVTSLYFYRPSPGDEVSPPSSVGLIALYSHTHSYIVSPFTQNYFKNDTFRLALGGAYGSIKSDLEVPELGAVKFSSAVYALAVRPEYRIIGDLFGGASGGYFVVDYQEGNKASEEYFRVYGLGKENIGMVGPRISYDSRDNQFYPYSGIYATVEALLVPEAFGAETTYHSVDLEINDYVQLWPGHVLALRGYGRFTPSDTPYIGLSKLGRRSDLRGYTPGEHVARNLISTQAEYRWMFARRWGVVAFGGVAALYDGGLSSIESDKVFPSGGAGVRFALHEENRVNFRVDYAFGADDNGLYVSIGEAY